MRHSEPKALFNLFKAPSLLTIQERGKALSTLNHLLNRLLPPPLAEQCRVANYRLGILIIEVSSASWLTRLRYEQEKLRSQLRQNGLSGLASIQFKINPELNRNRCELHCDDAAVYQRKITPQSAEMLLALADNCSPKLKSSLIKLAKHATKIDNS